MESKFIFVYGTLKRGLGNHHFLSDSTYIGKGKTKKKYSLYVSGIPYVYKNENLYHILGEIFQVN